MLHAANAIAIFWKHLNYPNLFVCSVYQFHVSFHLLIILTHLGIPLVDTDWFKDGFVLTLKVHATVFVIIMVPM